MTPEVKLYKSVKKALDGMDVWWMKIHGGPMQRPGVPDLLIVVDGLAVFVELKADGKNATPLQEHVMAGIRKAGGVAIVARSVEEVVETVRKSQLESEQ
jgi:hypothetical protein